MLNQVIWTAQEARKISNNILLNFVIMFFLFKNQRIFNFLLEFNGFCEISFSIDANFDLKFEG